MRNWFRNMAIGRKLPLAIGLLLTLAVATLSAASYMMSRSLIVNQAANNLKGAAYSHAKQVDGLLHAIDTDIKARATTPSTARTLVALSDAFKATTDAQTTLQRAYITDNPEPPGQKDNLVNAVTGSSYGFLHRTHHPGLRLLQQQMGYYDIFLINNDGDVVYSVFKETDFATNLMTGEWADTGLGNAFRQARESDQDAESVFVDFTPYEPSAFAPAAFIARPVILDTGERLGVIAYQMPIGEINTAMSDLLSLPDTADGFLVGSDGYLRTDSLQSDKNDILATKIESPYILSTLGGTAQSYKGIDRSGRSIMGHAVPIRFLGTEYVAVVQISKRALLSGLNTAAALQQILGVTILTIAIGIGIITSRSITRPLGNLTTTVSQIAGGDNHTKVPETDRTCEIGQLARATEVFRQNALQIRILSAEQDKNNRAMQSMAAEREAASLREFELIKKREATDHAAVAQREAMMQQLGESFGRVVEAAREGEFSTRVEADFEDAILITLAGGINALMASIDDNLSRTRSVMKSIAEGDLTHYMDGTFHGDFADLQDSMNVMVDSLRNLVEDITESSTTLTASSRELRQTSGVLSQQAERNAAALEETSAALTELSRRVTSIHQAITDANQSAQTARNTATASETVATEATIAMDRIAEGSKEIARAVSVINDISFQINLLALNAGVEAARAGDSGRGFAVVAAEVRKLAQDVGDSARQITKVIKQSDQDVSDGVRTVAEARASLQAIAQSVIDISESFDEVTIAIAEQSVGIQSIATSIQHIDDRSQRQAASFEEVTASSHLLSTQAETLTQMTRQFKIAEAGAEDTATAAGVPVA
ncbi:methyl-accepting chemotaxis protein [Loktanella sp. R86503]|uniref:methyl-accepting chemotaxis protein n=1 Tax=Loktanella sp. R86503 TaxID=3093847 RepID=UPI0036DCB34E